jgi:hypothetical protein
VSYRLFREFLRQIGPKWHDASIASFFFAGAAPGLRRAHRRIREGGKRP